ncbi:MAG: lipid-binding SYLF domain-containing protein [Pseudomonadota bacterium]|nr:lipid-binding SYLF domain-containing protein [Pseudomonadota bacterium]
MSFLPRLAAVLLALGASATTWAGPAEEQRAQNAVRVLTEFQAIPESAIPARLFDQARAIVVVPDTLKIGLVFGGRRGHGLVSVKSPDGTWSNPSFVKLTGGSVGFQAGVQSSDVVLVFTGDRGLESIVNGKLTLGADASVAAGPVGRTTALATDGQLQAEIWSWSRARGMFAGVALDGAMLSIDDDANQAVYGAGSTPRMVFEGRTSAPSADAVVTFRDQLEEATAAARLERAGSVAPPPVSAAVPSTAPVAPEAQPQPFETVESPTRIEPLP